MPQFILNTPPRRKPPHAFYALDAFARGYVEAMFFTNGDTGEERENLLNELGVERLTRAAVASIKEDCDAFIGRIMPDGCFVRQWLDRFDDYDDAQAGRDFWFSRQGHGVGFWDRKELDPNGAGDALHKATEQSGEAYCEVSRGWIYHR